MQYGTRLTAAAGADLSLFGPFFLSVTGYNAAVSGAIGYNYSNSSKATYAAQNVAVSQTMNGGNLGLQVRLINGANIHIFAEGGGFYEAWSMNFDFTNATGGSGSAYPETSQTGIPNYGTYAKVGADVVFGQGFGFRFGARATRGTAGKIDALNGQTINVVTAEGYAGVLKQF